MNQNTIFLLCISLLSLISCENEICRNCNSYYMDDFEGNIDNFYGSFFVCEHDDMWEEIAWLEDCQGCWTINEGGDGSIIDADIYKIGVRHIPNTDIDNDNILNDLDDDIDNDGLLNFEDTTPYGTGDQTILELVICTEN